MDQLKSIVMGRYDVKSRHRCLVVVAHGTYWCTSRRGEVAGRPQHGPGRI